jgi:hypothetical protein
MPGSEAQTVAHSEVSADHCLASYSDVIRELRRHLTVAQIGEIVGVSPRQIQNWVGAAHRPAGDARERLLRLRFLLSELSRMLNPEGVEIWLFGPNSQFDHDQSPMDLLKKQQFDKVSEELRRLRTASRHPAPEDARDVAARS